MAVATLTCFVCQSKSESSDEHLSGHGTRRRRGKRNNTVNQLKYNCLDSTTWKIFCKYFYPTPIQLVGRPDSSTSTSFSSSSVDHNLSNGEAEEEAVAGPLPVFCPACRETIANLCNLHEQLELIQRQISKIVAQVSITFIQTEEKGNGSGRNGCDKKNQKEESRKPEDVVFCFMRRCIRRRYQPLVVVTKSAFEVTNPSSHGDDDSDDDDGGGNLIDSDPLALSPLSVPSNHDDDHLDLGYKFELSPAIKEEVKDEAENEIESTVPIQNNNNNDNPEIENQVTDAVFNNNPPQNNNNNANTTNTNTNTNPVITSQSLKIIEVRSLRKRTRSESKQEEKVVNSSESENEGESQSLENDPNYDPEPEEDEEPVKKRNLSSSNNTESNLDLEAQVKSNTNAKTKETENGDPSSNPNDPQEERNELRPTKDPKVGENLYEHAGKWRYEKKLNDQGKVIFCCVTCSKICNRRPDLLMHIKKMHIEVLNEYKGKWRYEKRLSEDQKVVTLHCLTCSKPFKTLAGLHVHIQIRHMGEIAKRRKVTKTNKGNKSIDPRRWTANQDTKVGDNIYEHAGKWRYEQKRNDQGNVSFCCLTCNITITKRADLLRHINSRHVKESSHPGQTQKIGDDRFLFHGGKYTITRVTDAGGISFKCDTCGAARKTLEIIKSHIRNTHIHKPSSWMCEQCGFTTSFHGCLREHQKTHMNPQERPKKVVCEECGKSFFSVKTLNSHKDVHRAEPFKCEVCGRTFVYRKGLQRHRKTENHPAPCPPPLAPFVPFKCSLCTQVFVMEESLTRHMPKCRGAKKYCDWCGGNFARIQAHKAKGCPKRMDHQQSTNVGEGEFNLKFN